MRGNLPGSGRTSTIKTSRWCSTGYVGPLTTLNQPTGMNSGQQTLAPRHVLDIAKGDAAEISEVFQKQ